MAALALMKNSLTGWDAVVRVRVRVVRAAVENTKRRAPESSRYGRYGAVAGGFMMLLRCGILKTTVLKIDG